MEEYISSVRKGKGTGRDARKRNNGKERKSMKIMEWDGK
jgi:hypothetical protein